MDRYKIFFKSNYGGAWEDTEIILRTPQSPSLETYSLMLGCEAKEAGISLCDYTVIVFSGHGCVRDNQLTFLCDKELMLSANDLFLMFLGKRMLLIADSCLCLTKGVVSTLDNVYNSLDESVSRPREKYRELYDNAFMKSQPCTIVKGATLGEQAADYRNGGLYSTMLLNIVNQIIQDSLRDLPRADRVYTIKEIQDSVSPLVSDINDHQHPDLEIGNGPFPPFVVIKG